MQRELGQENQIGNGSGTENKEMCWGESVLRERAAHAHCTSKYESMGVHEH